MNGKECFKICLFKGDWLSFLVKDGVFYDDGSGIIEATEVSSGKRFMFRDWVYVEVVPDEGVF